MVIITSAKNSMLNVSKLSGNTNWQGTADELQQYPVIAQERSIHVIALFHR